MKSMVIDSGGPVMPRSKSRATVRSSISSRPLEVRDALGRRCSAAISRSLSHAAVRLPRLALTAWCSGREHLE